MAAYCSKRLVALISRILTGFTRNALRVLTISSRDENEVCARKSKSRSSSVAAINDEIVGIVILQFAKGSDTHRDCSVRLP